MKLICPACGAAVTLEQFEQCADLLALHRAAGAFGEDWALVREYLELFAGQRAMKVPKLLRLAREIYQIYQSGKFEFDRGWWRVGRPEFLEALKIACNQIKPPVANHHYLLRVLSAAAQKTTQRQERELRQREAGLMAGREEKGDELADFLPDDPEWRAMTSRLSRAVRLAKTPVEREAAEKALQAHLQSGSPAGEQT